MLQTASALLPRRPHLHAAGDERFADGAEGAVELDGYGAEGVAVGVQLGGLVDLVRRKWLAAHRDAMLGEQLQDAGLGDVVALAGSGVGVPAW